MNKRKLDQVVSESDPLQRPTKKHRVVDPIRRSMTPTPSSELAHRNVVPPQPARQISYSLRALLPANYEVHFKDERRRQVNVLFVLPRDALYFKLVFNALFRAEYKRNNNMQCFFSNDECNVMLVTIEQLIRDPTYIQHFDELLWFIPSEETMQAVNKLIKDDEVYIKWNVMFGSFHAALEWDELNKDQRAMVHILTESHLIGHPVLCDATYEDAADKFFLYVSRWLACVPLIRQRDKFIKISVDTCQQHSTDDTADHVFAIIQRELYPLQIERQAHYEDSGVSVVISGAPITWWLINMKRRQIIDALALRGLKLLEVSLMTEEHVAAAMKDLRNKNYTTQLFALMCRTSEQAYGTCPRL